MILLKGVADDTPGATSGMFLVYKVGLGYDCLDPDSSGYFSIIFKRHNYSSASHISRLSITVAQ
jgi:hypothetical protein